MKKLLSKKMLTLFLFCLLIGVVLPIRADAATGTKLNKTKITLSVGDTYKLTVKGASQKVVWRSSNSKVATVNSKGNVTGKKIGKATITAKIGKKSLTCKVTVKKAKILSANKTSIQIKKKGSVKITFRADDGTLTYDIKDTDIVSCKWAKKWNGDITKLSIIGKRNGVTYITITNTYNKEKLKIKVTVKGFAEEEPEETEPEETEYGNISGNVSFFYNKFIGHRADTGAKIFLIPKDGSALKAEGIYGSSYIYTASVDGTGNYILQHIPVGEYRMLMVSRETKEGAYFNATSKETYYDGIAQYFYPNYMTQEKATEMVSFFVMYSKWHIEDVTVRKDETTVVSYDFGTTYI